VGAAAARRNPAAAVVLDPPCCSVGRSVSRLRFTSENALSHPPAFRPRSVVFWTFRGGGVLDFVRHGLRRLTGEDTLQHGTRSRAGLEGAQTVACPSRQPRNLPNSAKGKPGISALGLPRADRTPEPCLTKSNAQPPVLPSLHLSFGCGKDSRVALVAPARSHIRITQATDRARRFSLPGSPAALKRRLPTTGARAFSVTAATTLRAGTAADGVVG
jgi:hypothetical protein